MPKLPAAWRSLNREKQRQTAAAARVRRLARAKAPLAPPESAKIAGLRYVDDRRMAGIRRIGSTSRVRYVAPNGRTIGEAAELRRIKALVIPPAWKDVWICPDPRGHVQATGRDARGRKQYRYHARWREVRDEVKYGRLIAFAEALPSIRRRTAADVRKSGLPREKVLAASATFKSNAEAKRKVVAAIESVAKRLGNTKAVCRKCYIHPAILDAYMDGATIQTIRTRAAKLAKSRPGLTVEEAAVVGLIERRLRKTA